jgi:hypothetical protein
MFCTIYHKEKAYQRIAQEDAARALVLRTAKHAMLVTELKKTPPVLAPGTGVSQEKLLISLIRNDMFYI